MHGFPIEAYSSLSSSSVLLNHCTCVSVVAGIGAMRSAALSLALRCTVTPPDMTPSLVMLMSSVIRIFALEPRPISTQVTVTDVSAAGGAEAQARVRRTFDS